MEIWQDQGIVLSVRRHGENGAVVGLLTESRGRYVGYVRGAMGTKMRGTLEPGNLVDVQWQSRVSEGLGSFTLELVRAPAPRFMADALKLGALQAACALCDVALPEREAHEGLFHGLNALFCALEGDVWGAAYVMWEIAFLKELGFSLDLTCCAGGGDVASLIYVSPRTGRAISRVIGEPYKDRLLPLAGFLSPSGGDGGQDEVFAGLQMCGYFLEHWAFAHHSSGIPLQRLRFVDRFAKTMGIAVDIDDENVGHQYGAG